MIYEGSQSVLWDEVRQDICGALGGVRCPGSGHVFVCQCSGLLHVSRESVCKRLARILVCQSILSSNEDLVGVELVPCTKSWSAAYTPKLHPETRESLLTSSGRFGKCTRSYGCRQTAGGNVLTYSMGMCSFGPYDMWAPSLSSRSR